MFRFDRSLYETVTQAILYWELGMIYAGRPDLLREALRPTAIRVPAAHDRVAAPLRAKALELVPAPKPAEEEPEAIAA